MIRSLKDLLGYALHAKDGDIGKVDDFYFDDDAWVVRYITVDAGSWLVDRRVLITPISVDTANWNEHRILVNLTREQVKDSPDIDTHKPISRRNEESFNTYYGYAPYWTGAGLWGGGTYPGVLAGAPLVVPPDTMAQQDAARGAPLQDEADTHLRSVRAVRGYRIHARDGEIGHLSDLIIDDQSWRVNYMIIETGNWLVGKKVIVPPTWVIRVSWADEEIAVDLKRDTIKNSPEFDPETLLNKA